MHTLFSKIEIMGILIVNREGIITFKNKVAEQFEYYFSTLIEEVQSGSSSFCLRLFPVEISAIKEDDLYYVFFKPIDDYVHLLSEKESLNDLRKELNDVINFSFDGIVISDNKGKIIHQNPSYEQITGLSSKHCIGNYLQDLEKEGVIDASATLKVLKEGKSATIIQKISTGRTVLVSASPIYDQNGKIKKVVNNVRDLTQLNSLESEIRSLEQQNQQIHEELIFLKEQSDPKLSIIAQSEAMKDVINRSLRVAQIDSGVLIQGASGVGKEKIVELIHRHSYRKENPLIKINCGAIPESLLESELFGYESGSFTGAYSKGKSGLFEAGNQGTIFLDEIGEMSLPLQVKLLRVLQEHEIMRIGSTKPIPVDVRIIAATHRDLRKMIKEGKFREDLFYRLNIIPIHIPPLRERPDDVVPLVYHFLQKINNKYGLQRCFSHEALTSFQYHDWPGNVRELQNVIERIVLMSPNNIIDLTDIQRELELYDSSSKILNIPKVSNINYDKSLKDQISEIEAQLIQDALKKFKSIRQTAISLKLDQSTLVRKIQKYKIQK